MKSHYKIFQISMDLSVRSVLRGYLVDYRDLYGHLHYFTKETALRTLKDTGYEVLDYFYSQESVIPVGSISDQVVSNPLRQARRILDRVKRAIPIQLNRLFFFIHEDLAVRVTGR